MLEHKDYHIITTNADNAFLVADYDLNKVFHIQGEYIPMACSQHCHAHKHIVMAKLPNYLYVEKVGNQIYRMTPELQDDAGSRLCRIYGTR